MQKPKTFDIVVTCDASNSRWIVIDTSTAEAKEFVEREGPKFGNLFNCKHGEEKKGPLGRWELYVSKVYDRDEVAEYLAKMGKCEESTCCCSDDRSERALLKAVLTTVIYPEISVKQKKPDTSVTLVLRLLDDVGQRSSRYVSYVGKGKAKWNYKDLKDPIWHWNEAVGIAIAKDRALDDLIGKLLADGVHLEKAWRRLK